jgi:osmotically-inducible protein OsmY
MPQLVLDKSMEQQARKALDQSPIHAHRRLDVSQDGDILILQGRVESYYHKQMAQEVVRNICRGVQLVNEIAVEHESPVYRF